MPHERMYRKMRKELKEGTLVSRTLSGNTHTPKNLKDYFILGFDGASCAYYHVYMENRTTLQESRKRLERAAASRFESAPRDPEAIMQYVYESSSDIVAVLATGTDLEGAPITVLMHHKDIPEKTAFSLIGAVFSRFIAETGHAN